jgi:pyruvate dehydrogenase E1 component beta subunit
MTRSKNISFAQAINESLDQAMSISGEVFVFGQGVDNPPGVFHTTTGLAEKYSRTRVFDTPAAEASMTGVALGASLVGMRPVLVHQRLDFMLYSMDQIVNWAALWRYKSGGRSGMPFTIRAIVGKGWGQGPQHSKSLQAWFAHVPGLKVAMPATPFDAKGLLMSAIFGEDPCIFIEGRPLFNMTGVVPEEPYRVPFGKAHLARMGDDVSLVALGYMVPIALRAAELLQAEGISVEVIDLRSVTPMDEEAIKNSVAKTGRLVVADPAWRSFGVSAEIITRIVESDPNCLKAPVARVTFPDTHSPTSVALEKYYFPDEGAVAAAVRRVYTGGHSNNNR